MEMYFDRTPVILKEAINRYPGDEFKSPFRSTVPLLMWLQHAEEMVAEVVESLSIKGFNNLHLEYQVKPKSGRGNASHTDLLMQSETKVLGIEVKWTEPRYNTVGKWMKKGSNLGNRVAVMEGWLSYLQKFSDKKLSIEGMNDEVYQMVHRAASICSFATKPILAYLLFTEAFQPVGRSYIEKDMKSLWTTLGAPDGFPFYFVQVLIERNEPFRRLENLKKGTPETKEKVIESLIKGESLFRFRDFRVSRIE